MKIFLDTANIEHISHGVRLGVVAGVTTNPSLVSREGNVDYRKLVQEICSIVPGPVSTEVLGQDVQTMVTEAREIAKWAIKVNLTLCFALNQALLGAAAGATFISPFVGRLDDIGEDGMKVVSDIVEYLDYYQLPTQVIAASIRHPQHCLAAARVGAHIATVPYEVLLQLIRHPLTDIGIERFRNDWKRVMAREGLL